MTRIMVKTKELPRSGRAVGRDYLSRCEWCEVEMNKFLRCSNRTWVDHDVVKKSTTWLGFLQTIQGDILLLPTNLLSHRNWHVSPLKANNEIVLCREI